MSNTHDFKPSAHDRICADCGREINDYRYHFPPGEKAQYLLGKPGVDKPADFNDKVTFASGATSGGTEPPYHLMAWEGIDCTALRYGYGNEKHENGQTVLVEANWLKAFHQRDLKFFRDRAAHAIKHIRKEMSGQRDKAPGGNWGAVGWCQDMMPFVAKYDPEFYAAVTGITPHPGPRKTLECSCPRCQVMVEHYKSLPIPKEMMEKLVSCNGYESKSKTFRTECINCGQPWDLHTNGSSK